jgi:hypothetical protein
MLIINEVGWGVRFGSLARLRTAEGIAPVAGAAYDAQTNGSQIDFV